jgi:hypothetical protein
MNNQKSYKQILLLKFRKNVLLIFMSVQVVQEARKHLQQRNPDNSL